MWIGDGTQPSPPTQTGQAVLPHPAFQFMVLMVWLRLSTQGFRKSRTSRAGLCPAHLSRRRTTVRSATNLKPGFPAHPGAQPRGTTRTLARCGPLVSQHHVPVPLRSTVVTRFPATTRTLTPTGPFAASRGSLIHVTRTSKHPSPTLCGSRPDALHSLCAGRTILFGLRHFARRLARTADRIEFTGLCVSRRVTDCSFTSSCSPPGGIAPAQLLSVTGPSVSARSGTFTPLSMCALRRTAMGQLWPRKSIW